MHAYLTQGKNGIHYFHIDDNAPCLPPTPPTPRPPAKKKLCITIAFDFFWDDCNNQENWKQWLSKIMGVKFTKTRCIIVYVKV